VAVGRGDGPRGKFDFDFVLHEVLERHKAEAAALDDTLALEQASPRAGM